MPSSAPPPPRPLSLHAALPIFDDDGRHVPATGQPAQAGPDDPIRPPTVRFRLDRLLGQGRVEGHPLRMTVAVGAEPVAQFLVRVALALQGWRGHDTHSVEQLVAVSLGELGPVELARGHQRARGLRAEQAPHLDCRRGHVPLRFTCAPAARAPPGPRARASAGTAPCSRPPSPTAPSACTSPTSGPPAPPGPGNSRGRRPAPAPPV